MTPALTDTVTQEPGVHFSPSLDIKSLSANLNNNSNAGSKDGCPNVAYCDPALCLQEDFASLQQDESLSSANYQTVFVLTTSSDLNVQNNSCFPSKQEQDCYRQRFHAPHDAHPLLAEKKVKRELFPGTVSKVLADVNKLWDISVTEDEGVHRLNGRIDGGILAMPFAGNSTLPDLRSTSPMKDKLQKVANKETEAKLLHQKCLNRQKELLSRAQRARKHLQLLLAKYTADHCSQHISGLVKRKIEKLNVPNPSASQSSTGGVGGLTQSACGGFKQRAARATSTAVRKFSVSASRILSCIQQELDSDVTESSSDDDCDEKIQKTQDRTAEWNWLSERANIGSRWTWLQAQIAELEYKIHQLVDLHSQLRSKKSAQLTEMVSSLITAIPISLSPTSPAKPFARGKMTTIVPRGTSKLQKSAAPTVNGFSKQQPGRKRKRTRSKSSSILGTSSARTRPLLLFHKRNLYTMFPDYTPLHLALLPHQPLHGSNESWQTSNYSTWLSCDKPQKPVLVKRDVCEIDPNFHPVLSLPSDIPLHLYFEGLLTSNGDIKDALTSRLFDPDDDENAPYVTAKWSKSGTSSIGPQLVLNTPNQEGRHRYIIENDTRPVHVTQDDDPNVTPISQKNSMQTPNPSIVLSAARRRVRSESSYDIDNIVIPMNLIAPSKLEKLQYKEILTPSWKEVALEPLKPSLPEELEDLSDEAFLIRHQQYEQTERVRWSFWEQNKWPKRSRSSGQCLGSVLLCTDDSCSPNSVSPVSWDTPPPGGSTSQSLQSAADFQQGKAKQWKRRTFPLTEEAAAGLKDAQTITEDSSCSPTIQPTPDLEDRVVNRLHSSCDKENR
ncbi:KAT8 regulatory NSL complex subunit 1-like protein isoform X2 [Eleutherodactylus coqui]|uniref:KAT8 regulatory NSL complex subunit 1-like protein isoform X2 n=1 Tax=Eleutherodactylus coqui TaxID=57060 RepID=UPI003463508D